METEAGDGSELFTNILKRISVCKNSRMTSRQRENLSTLTDFPP